MTVQSSTLNALLVLGFERRNPVYGMETVGFHFPSLDLTACDSISAFFRPVVRLGGVLNTGRIIALIDSQIPHDLPTPLVAAAWVSYNLQSHREDLATLPQWFLDGEEHWDLIPHVHHQREEEVRRRAFEERPHCWMKRDHARVFRRELRLALEGLSNQTEALLSFDGRVLSVRIEDERIETLAQGEPWPAKVQWAVSANTKLPKRFLDDAVCIGYFEGKIDFSTSRYQSKSAGVAT